MPFKKTFLAAALALAALPMAADDDFGLYTELSAEKKLTKTLSADLGLGFRSEQKLKSASRWDISAGASYKPFRFLKFSAGYVYMYDRTPMESEPNLTKKGKLNGYNVDHGYWASKHRAYADVTGKLKIGRLSFGLRERYQYTHTLGTDYKRTRFRDPVQPGYVGESYVWNGEAFYECETVARHKEHKNRHYLRSRLTAEYNIRHCPVTPSVSYELSNNLSKGFELDKTRLSAGVDWKITKQHILSASYMWQDGQDDDNNNDIHAIEIGYKFKF